MNFYKKAKILITLIQVVSCASPNLARMLSGSEYIQVKNAIRNGANVNIPQENSLTYALHIAARDGHYEIARLLIEHGARVDIKDENKNTPLHLATSKCNVRLIELLIQHKANVNAVNKFKQSPWDLACGPLAKKLLLGAGTK